MQWFVSTRSIMDSWECSVAQLNLKRTVARRFKSRISWRVVGRRESVVNVAVQIELLSWIVNLEGVRRGNIIVLTLIRQTKQYNAAEHSEEKATGECRGHDSLKLAYGVLHCMRAVLGPSGHVGLTISDEIRFDCVLATGVWEHVLILKMGRLVSVPVFGKRVSAAAQILLHHIPGLCCLTLEIWLNWGH